jgi:cytochrome c oxidase subunit 4
MSHAAAHEAPDPALLAEEARRYHHFITLALWLAVVTGIEIVLIYLPLSAGILLTTLSLLSAGKFFAVILWFMHLIYDKRLLFWLFMSGLVLAFATFAAMIALFDYARVDTKWFG